MRAMARGGIEEQYSGYTVYDEHYEKVGKVDDLFVGEYDEPEYVGVKMGFLGTRTTLIPMDAVRVNEKRHLIQVAAPKDAIEEAPTFDDGDITPEFERRVHQYYGTNRSGTDTGESRAYGDYYADDSSVDERVDPRPGERKEPQPIYSEPPAEEPDGVDREDARAREARPATGYEDADRRGYAGERGEIRVERKEEELVAETREREAGHVNVRKRVRTEKQRLRVPKRREEVYIDRVAPSEGSWAGAEIGEEEFRIPVAEEEVVVEKRPEVKEELRIRKEVVEDEEVVEADLRKEEVEVEDDTERRGSR